MLCPLELPMLYFETRGLLSRKTGLRSHFQEHIYRAVFILEMHIVLRQMLYLSIFPTPLFTKASINTVLISLFAEDLKVVANEGRVNQKRKDGFTVRKDDEHSLQALGYSPLCHSALNIIFAIFFKLTFQFRVKWV